MHISRHRVPAPDMVMGSLARPVPGAGTRGTRRIALLVLAALLLRPAPSREASPCVALLRGGPAWQEELTFTIKWKFVSAGTAILRLIPFTSEGGEPRFRIETKARSNSFIDSFYRVRDESSSVVDGSFKRSLFFSKKQREGSFVRDEVLEYDTVDNKGFFFRNGKLLNTQRLPEEYTDPLSGLYCFRLIPVEPGSSVSMYATDGRRLMRVRGDILKRERVTVPAGAFDCLKVELFPETMEGPFIRKQHGRVFIWFSDDECRLPVKFSTEVIIGAVEVLLEKVEYRSQKVESRPPAP